MSRPNPWQVLARLDVVDGLPYLRVSEDHSKRARSITEQDADLARDCEDHGWRMGPAYAGPSRGASRQSRDKRPDFDTLISDLDSGRFAGRVLLLWTLSRGSRRVREWVDLIELCEARDVFIWAHAEARLFDPGNPRDRRDLIKAAADSEAEVSITAEQIQRASRANAEDGRPHGRIPWGYRRVYDPQTRQLVAQEEEEAEAAMVRELFDRLLAGHSLRSIAADFKARGERGEPGFRTRSGSLWWPQSLRHVALNPTCAGMRVLGGRGDSGSRVELSQLREGTWPALVELSDWLKVHRMLCDPARVSPPRRPGRARYLLSRIARCGVCGEVLGVRYRGDEPQYYCQTRGCVSIPMTMLDPYAEKMILEHLARPEVIASMRASETAADEELNAVVNELSEKRALHEELALQLAGLSETKISIELAAKTERLVNAQIGQLEARYVELTTPSELRDLMTPGATVAERWKQAPISTRRRVAALVLTPESSLGELRLLRAPVRGRGAANRYTVRDRVRWWRGEKHPASA
jgi:site-specific DNA recombinase